MSAVVTYCFSLSAFEENEKRTIACEKALSRGAGGPPTRTARESLLAGYLNDHVDVKKTSQKQGGYTPTLPPRCGRHRRHAHNPIPRAVWQPWATVKALLGLVNRA